jgi:uncharacterized protein
MNELWISLDDIPAEGREFHFTDQSLWTGPMKEFGIAVGVAAPFEASLLVTPQDEGFLVSGSFSGTLSLSCSRCAEDFELAVSGRFDGFEEPGADKGEGADVPEEARTRLNRGKPELDVAGYLWEHFLLELPETPLCAGACKGLCPKCGINKNQGSCACATDSGDPRLAVLRNLKLS